MKRICVIWLFITLAFGSAILIIDASEYTEGKIVVNDGVKYVIHAPIRINSNADFDEAHGVVNWATGDGSLGNPWIIEGWDINGSGIGTCIFVGNTTDYFIIRDNHLHHANGTFGWDFWINCGIHLYYVVNGEIDNNTAHSNAYGGLFTYYSDNNIMTNNTFYNHDNFGIWSDASNWNIYDGNIIHHCPKGIYLLDQASNPSDYNIITNNNITNVGVGIRIRSSDHNSIINNNLSWDDNYTDGDGIKIDDSRNTTVLSNDISNSVAEAIEFSGSDFSTVENNTLLNNRMGIHLLYSPYNTFFNNTMIEGGFHFFGAQFIQNYNTQSIDTSNTVNGKPVYYLKDQNGGSVPLDAGQVLLANCANITVNNLTFTNLYVGVEPCFSENITITNVTSTNNVKGIYSEYTDNSEINNCILSYNEQDGLFLYKNNRIDVASNKIISNERFGIVVADSHNNTIHNNNVSHNGEYGMDCYGVLKYNNYIFNNNFINNTNQSIDIGVNFWNQSFPIGGNYWSDYTGIDAGGDGFGDTPYTNIEGGSNVDYLPLMNPGPPTVNLTAPDGGEVWDVGTFHDINWTMNDARDAASALRVTLDYSIDGGVSFPYNIILNRTGFSEIANYNWQIPDTPSTNCVMRVTVEDTTRNIVIDTSNFSVEIDSVAPLPATNPYAELTGTNDVTIYWMESPSPDVDHYEIWFVQNGWDKTGDSYTLLDSVPAGTSSYVHTNRGVNNGNYYAYQVRTFDAVGNEARTYRQAAKYGRTLQFAQSEWWLLSSCVVQSNTSLNHVIQGEGMPGVWDYALAWDKPTEQWISHLDGRPSGLNGLTDITNKMGFWLHTTGNARFTTAGYIANTTINLQAGWNLVGYPTLNHTETVGNALWGTGADTVMVCDTSEPYHIKEVGPTYIMKPGDGYWVHVPADTVWTIDW